MHMTLATHGDILFTITTSNPPSTIRVSSSHLILASNYYRAMLTGNFPEAHELRKNKSLNLTLNEDNADAMLIVMRAVHGQFREIPSDKLRLELLKDIAVIVDKYDLLDSVSTMAYTWIETVRIGNPRARIGQIASWLMCVMWVFNMHWEFKQATRDLIVEYAADVDLSGTCVPTGVSDKITNRRDRLYSSIRSAIRAKQTAYTQHSPLCDAQCDQIVQKRLKQIMDSLRRGGPSRAKPATVRTMVGGLYDDRMDDHRVIQNVAQHANYQQPGCIDRLAHLDRQVDQLCEAVQGLNLGQLKGDSDRKIHWSGRTPVLDFARIWPWAHNDT
ncbi:hypothetical protein MW887_001037 [Aspergillus wentii]|nr:hypothetical protein MW887_001037 [Aspergillus wentii]